MNLKKFMLIDLMMLVAIGFAGEMFGVYLLNRVTTPMMITTVVSLLVTLIALTRWSYKGLIITPILALASFLAGRFLNYHPEFIPYYDWKYYISTLVQLLSVSICFLWFKYLPRDKTYKSFTSVIGLCFIVIISSQLSLTIMYLILAQSFQLLGFAIWNVAGFAILIIGMGILRKQNVLIDVEENLKNQQIERKAEENFRFKIDEQIETSKEEEGDFKNGESKN